MSNERGDGENIIAVILTLLMICGFLSLLLEPRTMNRRESRRDTATTFGEISNE